SITYPRHQRQADTPTPQDPPPTRAPRSTVNSPFTAEWLNEVERRLDYYHRDLRSHPARDPYGREGGYPITWIGIGADVYQPLQLKYLNHVEVDRTLRVVTSDYR
ncbi:hypothetical protein, partial [Micrococcus luteus]|uniref:hypothetical protein n=1 Tax=Micrococcus luteus TaxID=1270 RepID=UPI00362F0D50